MDYQTTLPGTQVPRLCGQTKFQKIAEKFGLLAINNLRFHLVMTLSVSGEKR